MEKFGVLIILWCYEGSCRCKKNLVEDNFDKRNVLIIDQCCMCKKSGNSVEVLLLVASLFGGNWQEIFGHLCFHYLLVYLSLCRKLCLICMIFGEEDIHQHQS